MVCLVLEYGDVDYKLLHSLHQVLQDAWTGPQVLTLQILLPSCYDLDKSQSLQLEEVL